MSLSSVFMIKWLILVWFGSMCVSIFGICFFLVLIMFLICLLGVCIGFRLGCCLSERC